MDYDFIHSLAKVQTEERKKKFDFFHNLAKDATKKRRETYDFLHMTAINSEEEYRQKVAHFSQLPGRELLFSAAKAQNEQSKKSREIYDFLHMTAINSEEKYRQDVAQFIQQPVHELLFSAAKAKSNESKKFMNILMSAAKGQEEAEAVEVTYADSTALFGEPEMMTEEDEIAKDIRMSMSFYLEHASPSFL